VGWLLASDEAAERRLLDRAGLADEPAHRSAVRVISELARRCISQEAPPARVGPVELVD
jgi:hypothetical protein